MKHQNQCLSKIQWFKPQPTPMVLFGVLVLAQFVLLNSLLPVLATPKPAKQAVVKADVNNVPLNSVIKLEHPAQNNQVQTSQPEFSENYAVGGVTAEPPVSPTTNIWQVITALLLVSASAWWVLNTAWFRQLATQRQAQLGGATAIPSMYSSNASIGVTQPTNPFSQWLHSVNEKLFSAPVAPASAEEVPLATVLQTVPLGQGHQLVLVHINATVLGIVTGSLQPTLLAQWPIEAFGENPATSQALPTEATASYATTTSEKWMAQEPPIPVANASSASTAFDGNLHATSQTQSVPDYETLNEAEKQVLSHLLHTEKGAV